ncbi:MAG TPA: MIP/aquaporin family protein [Chitinophagaceae bacterium]|nr:MIP/aquaporin family protein [Chitinophagaceae bacterium]
MSPFLGEFIGTALLVLLGDGVVANVVLNKTKGNNSGWIVITFGWAIAVFTGVYISAGASGAHLNPAVTVASAILEKSKWADVPVYIGAQLLGAMAGALFVWLSYRQHFSATNDADAKLAVFCTGPAIRKPLDNFITEFIGTFVLIIGVLFIGTPADASGAAFKLGALDALPVALLVLGIGLSLGGPTGYAINPARDFGPRLMHFILPIPGKRNSDWAYAWIPILGPLAGAVVAALVFKSIS